MTAIYAYHPETGQYLGQGTADESPLEPGVYLVPANATVLPPPKCKAGKQAVFHNGAWASVDVSMPCVDQVSLRIAQIQTRFIEIDTEGARPAREIALAMIAGKTPDAVSINKLSALENEAAALRSELKALQDSAADTTPSK